MSTKALGTILPTVKSLAITDCLYDVEMSKAIAKAAIDCAGMVKQNVGGEIRYYKTATLYTPVSRNGRRRWFEVRADGDYAIK